MSTSPQVEGWGINSANTNNHLPRAKPLEQTKTSYLSILNQDFKRTRKCKTYSFTYLFLQLIKHIQQMKTQMKSKENLNIDLINQIQWLSYSIRKLQTSSFFWLNKTIMNCLFKEVDRCYISSKILWCSNIEVSLNLYMHQANTSSARAGISFQNNLPIFKLLMLDMQYWKCNNISSAWKIKWKLKI